MGTSPLLHPVASLEVHTKHMAKDKVEKVELEEVKEVKVKKSDARLAFEAVIEENKKRNPVKYEAKKKDLEAQLEAIK